MAPVLRVLRVIHDLQVGGVQRMLLRTLGALRELDVHAEVLSQTPGGEMAPAFREAGFPVHDGGFRSRLDPLALWSLRRRAARFDVVHGHMYAANVAVNVAMVGAGGVVVNGYHSQTPLPNASQRRMARLTRGVPSAWVAVSEAVRAPLVEAGIPDARIRTIHNGYPVPEVAEPLPALPPGAPLELVFAGRFVGQKRLHLLVEVVAKCRAEGVPVRLTLVGDGPRGVRLEEQARDAGVADWVRFPGLQSDVTPFLRAAHLYATASEREGFPNALLEAVAHGRGVIASDIAPHRELLGDDGAAGIVLGDDPKAWVACLRGLVEAPDRIAAMSDAAFGRARLFSLEATARRTLELYRELIADRRRP